MTEKYRKYMLKTPEGDIEVDFETLKVGDNFFFTQQNSTTYTNTLLFVEEVIGDELVCRSIDND